MEFTGERFVPQLSGEIKYEHLHRYAIALDFVADRSVLDIASGEGYGSALLAKRARSVVGVDIDSDSINYARTQYSDIQNLKFLLGSCSAIPVADASIDVVVSFETIEHHDQHEEMMQEIKRVLKPDGVLILSSPNRLTYADEAKQANPFHIKELYYAELVDLLKRHFSQVQICGQKLAVSSWITPIEAKQIETVSAYSGNVSEIQRYVDALPNSVYFVAICSDDAELKLLPESVYLDAADDVWKQLSHDHHLDTLKLIQLQHEYNHICHERNRFEYERNGFEHERNHIQHKLNQIQHEHDQLQYILHQTQHQLEQRSQELTKVKQDYQDQLQQVKSVILAMESSKFWKLRTLWMRLKYGGK